MKAIKIKMKPGCGSSSNLEEIDQIYIDGPQNNRYFSKASVHDFLKENPNSIQVNIFPFPNLQPMVSQNGEKYVRSEPDGTGRDNLLNLPRE